MLRPLFLLFALLAAPMASAQASKPFFPYPMKSTRLPNGLTVIRVPFKAPGLVSFYTVVRVGSRNEVEPGHTGFAHFFEHVMFKGTEKYPEGKRDELIGRLGFNENAFTTDDITVYHVDGPSSGVETVVEVEADRFRNLKFGEQTFQTEAKAVLGEYHKSAASPGLKIAEELGTTAFTKHPYQHTTLGFYADIQKMPGYYEYSQQFFKRWYTPDNTILVIAGEFDDAKLMASIKKHYASWKGTVDKLAIPAEPAQTSARQVQIDWPNQTLPRHVLAWHSPAASTKTVDAALQNVLAAYLVGATSPVYKEVVLEKQLAESVSTDYSEHRDPTLFILQATLKREAHRVEVHAALERAVKELSGGKVDAKRVEAIKKNLRYGLLMNLESAHDVAGQVAWYAGIYGASNALDLHYQNISRIRPDQLVAFAKKYLSDTNRTTLTLKMKSESSAATDGGAR